MRQRLTIQEQFRRRNADSASIRMRLGGGGVTKGGRSPTGVTLAPRRVFRRLMIAVGPVAWVIF